MRYIAYSRVALTLRGNPLLICELAHGRAPLRVEELLEDEEVEKREGSFARRH